MRNIKYKMFDRVTEKIEEVTQLNIESNIAKFVTREGYTVSRTIGKECDLMKYIGHTDINGQEICEGHILNIGEEYDYQKNLLVRWCDKSCAFVMDNGTTRSFSFIQTESPVIIGNKFQNSELLDGEAPKEIGGIWLDEIRNRKQGKNLHVRELYELPDNQ